MLPVFGQCTKATRSPPRGRSSSGSSPPCRRGSCRAESRAACGRRPIGRRRRPSRREPSPRRGCRPGAVVAFPRGCGIVARTLLVSAGLAALPPVAGAGRGTRRAICPPYVPTTCPLAGSRGTATAGASRTGREELRAPALPDRLVDDSTSVRRELRPADESLPERDSPEGRRSGNPEASAEEERAREAGGGEGRGGRGNEEAAGAARPGRRVRAVESPPRGAPARRELAREVAGRVVAVRRAPWRGALDEPADGAGGRARGPERLGLLADDRGERLGGGGARNGRLPASIS